jgi:hypothetical protein
LKSVLIATLRFPESQASKKSPRRRLKMDRSTEWPWSWEEEVEWKADLEERDYEFLEELINSALENDLAGSRYVLGLPQEEELADDGSPEKYLVTA